ncbi:hypothetical protein ACHAWO_010147, partial [Cyclotella atomus]
MGAIELDKEEAATEAAALKVDTDKDIKFISTLPALLPRKPKFSNTNIALLTKNTINIDNAASSCDDLLCEIPNIVTKQEAQSLVYSFDKGLFGKEWSLEGYDRQHRVQRYQRQSTDGEINAHEHESETNHYDNSSNYSDVMEESFGWLFDRIIASINTNVTNNTSVLNHRPYEVIVTEHTPSSCRSVVDTFEQFPHCDCITENKKCGCYIANVTLVNNAIVHLEKPQIRDLDCWDVTTPIEEYSGELIMEENGAVVKMGDCLWNWRGRIMDVQEKSETLLEDEIRKPVKKGAWVRTKKLKALNKRSITISFRGIHPSLQSIKKEQVEDVGLMDPQLLAKQIALASRPLSELLTIIVTTSPIRSNPSTEMLEHTFDTFQFAGEEFAFECKKVIVCDGCRVLEEVQQQQQQGNSNNNNNASVDQPPKIRIY